MSDVKLLPCPFCGGEIKLDEDDFYMFRNPTPAPIYFYCFFFSNDYNKL